MKIKDWRYTVEGMSIHLECECGGIQCVLLTNLHISQIIGPCHSCGKEEAVLLVTEPKLYWATSAAVDMRASKLVKVA